VYVLGRWLVSLIRFDSGTSRHRGSDHDRTQSEESGVTLGKSGRLTAFKFASRLRCVGNSLYKLLGEMKCKYEIVPHNPDLFFHEFNFCVRAGDYISVKLVLYLRKA
jgi:hypothetical protein